MESKLYDKKLEQKVLGQIISDEESFNNVSTIFHPELFYDHDNFLIAEKIVSLKDNSQGVDIVSVYSGLKIDGKINDRLNHVYISGLTTRTDGAYKLETHVLILQEIYMKRKMVDHCNQTISEIEKSEDVFDCMDSHERRFTQITSKIILSPIFDSLTLYNLTASKNDLLLTKKGLSGVASGFTELDRNTGGWHKGNLIILAARPGMGKSALALKFARNAAILSGDPGVIFSLEMTELEMYDRMKSQESGIELKRITKEGLNKLELAHMDQSCLQLAHAKFDIDPSGEMTVFQLKNKLRKWVRDKKIKWAIIDYLQYLSSGEKFYNKETEVSKICRALKAIAKELQIPIIALSQLSRDVEKRGGDKIPVLSDLRDSGSIEQDADVVMFIYRPEYYDITQDAIGNSTKGKAMIIIAKNRNGSLENIELNFNGGCTDFTDPIKMGTINY